MFRGMHYVYSVYKERSFSRAAAALHISQPSLSANIRRIEEKVGCPLFDRSTKPLEVTECGARYIRCAEEIMAIENSFESYINDLEGLKTGTLNFGGSNFFSSWVLPPMISDFSREYPDLNITLTEARSVELTRMLQDAVIDFVMDNKELDLEVFDRRQVGNERLLLVVPEGFSANRTLGEFQIPLSEIRSGSFRESRTPSVPLYHFTDCPFILLHPENDTGKRSYQICQEQSFHPHVVLELDQQLTAYNIASSGLGITFSGERLLSSVPPNPKLVYYKLASRFVTRNIYLYWKRGRYVSKAMQVFMEFIASPGNSAETKKAAPGEAAE